MYGWRKILVLGNSGEKLGDWMIQGAIYIAGAYKSLGNNAKEEALTDEDKKNG